MASPAEPTHPLTPPAEQNQPSQQQTQSQPTPPTTGNAKSKSEVLLSEPLTSLDDNGTSKRPRDHRLIHLLLASHGVSAYQERVPLQLMDFAYRYTSNVLSDALHIQNEGYEQAESGTTGKGGKKGQKGGAGNAANDEGDISLASLRFSIGSRMGYQMSGSLPKEFLKGLADERNRVSLATHSRDGERGGAVIGGVKLPHEKYCLTGVGWGLKDEWESEGEESVDDDGVNGTQSGNADAMQVDDGEGMDEENEDEEGMGTIEDVFGPDGGGDGDETMQD